MGDCGVPEKTLDLTGIEELYSDLVLALNSIRVDLA
jgi:hypothetical protein